MPTIGTQMYWHEAPTPLPPWASEEQRAANVALSRSLNAERISPLTSGAYLVGNKARDAANERTRLKDARVALLNVGRGALTVEPLLSHRCVLNMLLASLGAAPLGIAECTAIVTAVRNSLQQSDVPMAACAQAVARSRGLEARSLSREELKHRRCTFFPTDLPPGRRVLLICSKIDPLFIGVYTEWLPTGRRAGQAARRGAGGSMRVLCPAHQPRPWHKRVQVLRQIDRNEAMCVYLSAADDAGTLDAEIAAAQKGLEARKKRKAAAKAASGKKGQKEATAAAASASSAVPSATAGNGPSTAILHKDGFDSDSIASDDLDADIFENSSEEDNDGDEVAWSDVDEASVGIAPSELIGPASAIAGASSDGASTPSRGRQRQSHAPRTMIAPLQTEASASVADPFSLLPPSSSVVAAPVLEALKGVRSRSSATWTQRVLRQRDRRLLYNLVESQLAME